MDKQKAGAQISLFGSILEEQSLDIKMPNVPEYETMEKLSKEKSVLGVYVSGHPFEKFLPYFKDETFNCSMLNAYTEDEDGVKTYTELKHEMPVTMGGMISAFKKLKTRSGTFMAFVTVEDLYGSVECVCFPKVYEKMRSFLEADKVVSVSGKISIDAEKLPVIIADKITEFIPPEENVNRTSKPTIAKMAETDAPRAPMRPTEKPDSEKKLWLNVTGMEEADIEELMETLTYYKGETPVFFVKDGKKMRCTETVTPGKGLMAELLIFLPQECIKLT
jgi:DNA polymerase III alpha subunit